MTTTAKRHRWTKRNIQAEVDKLPDEVELYWDYRDEMGKEDIEKIVEHGLEGLDEVQMALSDLNQESLWEQKELAIKEHLDSMRRKAPVSDKVEAQFRELVDESDKLLESINMKDLARNSGGAYFVVIVNEPEISFQAWRGVESRAQVDELCALCDLLHVNPSRLQELVTCDNDNRPEYDPDPAIFPILPSRHGDEYVSIESMLATLSETSHGGQLVFMVKMDIADLVANPEGYTKGPLTVCKGTLGLIYDYCNGAGSCEDMELLKDIVLPEGTYSFELDASRNYGLQSCYGFTDKPWKLGSLIPHVEKEEG